MAQCKELVGGALSIGTQTLIAPSVESSKEAGKAVAVLEHSATAYDVFFALTGEGTTAPKGTDS